MPEDKDEIELTDISDENVNIDEEADLMLDGYADDYDESAFM